MCVHVCAQCAGVCAGVCMCAHACACSCVCMCARVCACVQSHPSLFTEEDRVPTRLPHTVVHFTLSPASAPSGGLAARLRNHQTTRFSGSGLRGRLSSRISRSRPVKQLRSRGALLRPATRSSAGDRISVQFTALKDARLRRVCCSRDRRVPGAASWEGPAPCNAAQRSETRAGRVRGSGAQQPRRVAGSLPSQVCDYLISASVSPFINMQVMAPPLWPNWE